MSVTSPESSPLTPDDAAALRMLAGAHFGPNANLTLPSGRTLTPDEAQALTSAYAPPASEPNSYMPGATPPVSPAPGYGPPYAHQPWPYQGPPAVAGHVKRTKRRRNWIIAAAAIIVTAIAVAVTAIALIGQAGPTIEDAQRECRTAFDREINARILSANQRSAVATITDINLQESRKISGGYEVNGTVHYNVTAPFVGSMPGSVELTCTAREHGGQLSTTVRNR